jgi:hypothetical protein
LTTGTIEEKVHDLLVYCVARQETHSPSLSHSQIYHRQIFKQLLSNRILSHPRQQRLFQAKDLRDLFVFTEEDAEGTSTGALFADCAEEVVAKP